MRAKLHPATILILWLVFAVGVQRFAPGLLVAVAGSLGVLAWVYARFGFTRLVLRVRWLFLSLFLIYALASPGAPAVAAAPWLPVTEEGLRGGAIQALRLLVVLEALSLLLAALSRERLLAGLTALLCPFGRASAQRVAIRLWLTLHYLESAPPGRVRDSLLPPGEKETPEEVKISLETSRFTWRDAACLAALIALFWVLPT